MMLPSSPQLPPRPLAALHKVMAEPPSTEIFCSFRCSEESDPLPVRGKERSICPLRSCKLSGVGLIEPPGKEPPLRHVHHPRAVGRNDFVGSGRRAKRHVRSEVNVQPHERPQGCSTGRVARHNAPDVTTAMIVTAAATAHGNLLVEAGAACVAPESFGAAIASSISIRKLVASRKTLTLVSSSGSVAALCGWRAVYRWAVGSSPGLSYHCGQNVPDVVTVKRLLAGQQFIQHAAKRKDVRALVHCLPRACSGVI